MLFASWVYEIQTWYFFLQKMPSVSVKDVNQQAFTRAFAKFLKKQVIPFGEL